MLTGAIAAGVVAVACVAGAIRVLPMLLTPGVPWGVVTVLGRGIVFVALETAFLVAPPIAWALSAARLVERGEARALFANGVRPLRVVADGWAVALCILIAAALAATAWGREATAPGRVVRDLVAEGRAACLAMRSPISGAPPVVLDVPILGISWVCADDPTPFALGPLAARSGIALGGQQAGAPTAGGFTATAITVPDDLHSLQASGLTLLMGSSSAAGGFRLHATSASIQGLAPALRASNLSVPQRVGLLSMMAVGLAVLAAALTLRQGVAGRITALAIGAGGPATALLVFSVLERTPTPFALYAAVPAVGATAMLATAAFARR